MNKSFGSAETGAIGPFADTPVLKLVDVDTFDVPIDSTDPRSIE